MERKRGLGSGQRTQHPPDKQFRGCPEGEVQAAAPVFLSVQPCIACTPTSRAIKIVLGRGRWGAQRLSFPCRPPHVECTPSLPHPPLGPPEPQRTLGCVPSNSGWFFPRWGKRHPSHLSRNRVFTRSLSWCGRARPQRSTGLGGYKQRPVSDSSGGCMLEIGVPARLGSGGSPLWCAHCHLLVVPSRGGKRVGELAGIPFIKTLVPFMKAVPS